MLLLLRFEKSTAVLFLCLEARVHKVWGSELLERQGWPHNGHNLKATRWAAGVYDTSGPDGSSMSWHIPHHPIS